MYFGAQDQTGWGQGPGIAALTPQSLSFNQGPVQAPSYQLGQVETPNLGQQGGVGGLAGNVGNLGVMDYSKLALGGLQTLGNLYMAFQANKLAKKQFNFTKEFSNANLANEIQSYNTTLEDRIRSRSVTEGRAAGYADEYLSKNKLPDRKLGG